MKIVNDISQLNPISVSSIISPTSTLEIVDAVKGCDAYISIGGGKFSMGGQIATENCTYIDMRNFDKIVSFSESNKEITVQSGIVWRKLQEFVDKYDLSVKIKQTYSNFTVGGSLSVNCHGRYVGGGAIIKSVKQIKIILPNGDLIAANRNENKDIFNGAIGGYGGLGVITEITLSLTDNSKVERFNTVMSKDKYKEFFLNNIRNNPNVVFHNADLYPNIYNRINAVSYIETDKVVTVKNRLKPNNLSKDLNKIVLKAISDFSFGKSLRENVLDPIFYKNKHIAYRNYEASYDVADLEPESREESTYILQEYFVPINQFDVFAKLLGDILRRNKVNVMNVSIRHCNADNESILSWSRSEVFAFVVYYNQGVSEDDKKQVEKWTRKLINAVILCNGAYYLPYQIIATKEQFFKSYPNAPLFFNLKRRLDPAYKFRNKLFDAYYV